jgi:hypothetical protein
VAFGKVEIKEHGVSLLFEEWNHVEEGQQIPRVWIRIFRLPQKLHEFSVLWALDSMLGATQSVDMISSLRNDYRRVEVAVLDVNLLPNKIEYVVIGDRLFTLPIQVEGRDDAPPDQHMEVDNSNDENGGSGEMKELEPNNEQLEQSGQGNNGTASSQPPHSKSKSDGKQTG